MGHAFPHHLVGLAGDHLVGPVAVLEALHHIGHLLVGSDPARVGLRAVELPKGGGRSASN